MLASSILSYKTYRENKGIIRYILRCKKGQIFKNNVLAIDNLEAEDAACLACNTLYLKLTKISIKRRSCFDISDKYSSKLRLYKSFNYFE